MESALALLEFHTIATGIEAGDAMVKHAPVERIVAGTVQPGHYLVMVSGDVASVEEAFGVGKAVGIADLCDSLFLPHVHPDVVAGLAGEADAQLNDAIGVVETRTVPSAILAADAGLKGAEVALVQLRLADGLGGKGVAIFTGVIADIEAAVEIGTAVSQQHLVRQLIIPQIHPEMGQNVVGNGRFGSQFGQWGHS